MSARLSLRFYAELNDFLPDDKKQVEFNYESPPEASLSDILRSFNIDIEYIGKVHILIGWSLSLGS